MVSLEVSCLASKNLCVVLDATGCGGRSPAGTIGSAGGSVFFLVGFFSAEEAAELRVRGGDTLNWFLS